MKQRLKKHNGLRILGLLILPILLLSACAESEEVAVDPASSQITLSSATSTQTSQEMLSSVTSSQTTQTTLSTATSSQTSQETLSSVTSSQTTQITQSSTTSSQPSRPAQSSTASSQPSQTNPPSATSPQPTRPTDESSAGEVKDVQDILSGMSLEEKVGQLFFARCPSKNAAQKAAEYQLGGYILFARDFEKSTPEQVTRTIRSYQDNVRIPLAIGVDEEGGEVTRISRFPAFRSQPFPSPQALFQAGGFAAVHEDTMDKCSFLRRLGINMNFAPVCDVSENPKDYIYPRTFGKDAGQTAQYIETVVGVMKKQKMGSVLKHFPGYGGNADTHTGIATDDRPYETFIKSDFLPFRSGVEAGADMVMVSHNIVNCMDGGYPASLSLPVHDILRQELGFSGVIITDDLSMEGVRRFAENGKPSLLAVQAIQAGNDMVCCTDFEVQLPAVIKAVREGIITEERIDVSVLRILTMKISLGLL